MIRKLRLQDRYFIGLNIEASDENSDEILHSAFVPARGGKHELLASERIN